MHNGRAARGRIAEYRAGFAHGPADLPPEKLESYFWAMDLITGHYRVPDFFEDWVVGLAQRESLGSSFLGGLSGFRNFEKKSRLTAYSMMRKYSLPRIVTVAQDNPMPREHRPCGQVV
jgi:hypothetical protein